MREPIEQADEPVPEPVEKPKWRYAPNATPFRVHREVKPDPLSIENDGHPQGE